MFGQYSSSGYLAQSIITNTLVASGGRVVNIVLGVVVLGLVSRFLGVAQFGSFTVLVAYGAMLQIVADWGLYLTLTRAIAEHPRKENEYITHVVTLRIALLVVAFTAGTVVIYIIPALQGLLRAYSIIAVGFAAQSLSQLAVGVYQKYSSIWRVTAGDIIGRLAQVGGIIALGASRSTLTSMASLFALSTVLAATIHYYLLPKSVSVKVAFSWPIWRRLITLSLPLGALLILNTVYFRIDALLLSLFRPASEVGLYGIAYRLIESTLFFPAMFGGLLLPRLSAAWRQARRDQLSQYLKEGFMAVIWAAVFTVITLLVFAQPIIVLIAGPKFQAAAPLLQTLVFALAAMFIGNIAGFTLVACHRQKTLLAVSASLAVANVVLNLITIPRWGAAAAAWTTVLTESAAAAIATLVAYRIVRFRLPWKILVRLVLAATLTLLVYRAVANIWPLLVVLSLGLSVYVASSWWLGVVSRENMSNLLNVKADPTR